MGRAERLMSGNNGGRIDLALFTVRSCRAGCSGQELVVKEAVGFVRLVERVIDERVGNLAQTSPAGPGRLARSLLAGLPALAPRSELLKLFVTGRQRVRLLLKLTQTVGPAPPRRPDE